MRCTFVVRLSVAWALFLCVNVNALHWCSPCALFSSLSGGVRQFLVPCARFVSGTIVLAAVALAVVMRVRTMRLRDENRGLRRTIAQLRETMSQRDQEFGEAQQKLQEFETYTTELERACEERDKEVQRFLQGARQSFESIDTLNATKNQSFDKD